MKKRVNEEQIRNIVAEAVRKVLKEGTTDQEVLNKWDWIMEVVGAEQMLNCIYNWCNSDQLAQFITWFEEEGYLDGYYTDDEEEYEEDEM